MPDSVQFDEVVRLATQSLVNAGVCHQAKQNDEGFTTASKIFRRASQRDPSHLGSKRRLCQLLSADTSLQAFPSERVNVCATASSASPGASMLSATDMAMYECWNVFVTPATREQDDTQQFLQPTYDPWWVWGGILRRSTTVSSFIRSFVRAGKPAEPPTVLA